MSPRSSGVLVPHQPHVAPSEAASRQVLVLHDFPSPKLARTLSPNGRPHWRTKVLSTRHVNEVVAGWANLQGILPVGGPARLTIRYVMPIARKRDQDNYTTGVTKALIDGLVRSEILLGDDTALLTLAPVELVVERGELRTEVTIET